MTGFGRASVGDGGRGYVVEMRSVNHRYLDLRIRLPKALQQAESSVRELLTPHVTRGRVEISITSTGGDEVAATSIQIDHDLAQAVVEAHNALAESLGVERNLDTRVVAAWPGVLRAVETTLDVSEELSVLMPALESAAQQLVGMRRAEGLRLEQVLLGHLDTIEGLRQRFVEVAPGQAADYRERLEKRMRDLLENVGGSVDDSRLLNEVAVFAERTDIVEELERLHSHLEQARGLIASDGSEGVGRRLDFLCQEILREANTVGSKAQAIELTETVIELKNELERLREQVQNVE